MSSSLGGEWPFVIAAYAVAWVGLMGYGIYVHRRARRAEVALDATPLPNAGGSAGGRE